MSFLGSNLIKWFMLRFTSFVSYTQINIDFNSFFFIYFESEREHMAGRGRERRRERIPSRLRRVRTEPDAGLDPMT